MHPFSSAPVVSIAWIRRRTRGIGNEFALACDMRFASRVEIVLSGDNFDADIAERCGWVNRAVDDDRLDSFVDTLVARVASLDRETLAAARGQINRFGMPAAAELQSSNDLFFPLSALPGAQARPAKVRNICYGVRSDFQLNFGRCLPALGRPDGDGTDSQPG
jgi:enoyl-CoA hydratase/carnithine racemase